MGKAFIWDFKQLIICTLLCPSYVCTQLAPGPSVGSFQVFIFPTSSVQNLSTRELAEPWGTAGQRWWHGGGRSGRREPAPHTRTPTCTLARSRTCALNQRGLRTPGCGVSHFTSFHSRLGGSFPFTSTYILILISLFFFFFLMINQEKEKKGVHLLLWFAEGPRPQEEHSAPSATPHPPLQPPGHVQLVPTSRSRNSISFEIRQPLKKPGPLCWIG